MVVEGLSPDAVDSLCIIDTISSVELFNLQSVIQARPNLLHLLLFYVVDTLCQLATH